MNNGEEEEADFDLGSIESGSDEEDQEDSANEESDEEIPPSPTFQKTSVRTFARSSVNRVSRDQEDQKDASLQLTEAVKAGLQTCDEIESCAGELSRQKYLELCEASSKIFELLSFDSPSTPTTLIPDLKKIQESLRSSRSRVTPLPQSSSELKESSTSSLPDSPVIAPTQSKFSFKVKPKPQPFLNGLTEKSKERENEIILSDDDSSPLIVDDFVDEARSNFQFNWSDDDSLGGFQAETMPLSRSLPGPSAPLPQAPLEKDNFVSGARNDGTDSSLNKESFPHSARTRQLMRDKFGIKSYRTNQLQAINSALLGHDTFVLMPTGGGKSLCYQLPAVVQGGVTVVVSPLVSLIHDQVSKLTSLGIPAEQLSGDDQSRHTQVYTRLRGSSGLPALLYLTPERLASSQQTVDALTSLHRRQQLTRFVIDEAHCVSQWGHDFRPDYQKLHMLREQFTGVPFIALTATATPRVRTDILHQLGMVNTKWFLSSFNRNNLKYQVHPKKGKASTDDLSNIIQQQFRNKTGIVYCLSKKDCDDTAKDMRKAGIKAKAYHAGLGREERTATQDSWLQDKTKVVCATIAFGMGIDKPDVRFVIHQSIPQSIEGYYQESGRGGRDGGPCLCLLLYSHQDIIRMRKLIDLGEGDMASRRTHLNNLDQMVKYCEEMSECRRVLQLQYFGEAFDRNQCGVMKGMECDNCIKRDKGDIQSRDITDMSKTLVGAVTRMERGVANRFTALQLVEVWRGGKSAKVVDSGWDKDPLHGSTSLSSEEAVRVIRRLVSLNMLREEMVVARERKAIAYIKSGEKAQALMAGKEKVVHFVDTSQRGAMGLGDVESVPENEKKLRELEEECLEELKQVVLAAGQDYYPENKINNVNEVIQIEALRIISRRLPTSREQLLQVDYMTEFRCDQYESVIFGTTRPYHTIRMEHLKTMAAARQEQLQEEARTKVVEKSVKKSRRSGGKRKGRGRKKTGTSSRGRGRTASKTTPSRGGSSSSSRGRGRGGAGASVGSMGLPKFGSRFGAAGAGQYSMI